jgi:hypothetical protein
MERELSSPFNITSLSNLSMNSNYLLANSENNLI